LQCRDAHLCPIGNSDTARKQNHDEETRATGSNTRYLPEVATSSDSQVVSAYDAFDNPAMAAQTVEADAYRYHGGPKYND
jgi:hypothetical protein